MIISVVEVYRADEIKTTLWSIFAPTELSLRTCSQTVGGNREDFGEIDEFPLKFWNFWGIGESVFGGNETDRCKYAMEAQRFEIQIFAISQSSICLS